MKGIFIVYFIDGIFNSNIFSALSYSIAYIFVETSDHINKTLLSQYFSVGEVP